MARLPAILRLSPKSALASNAAFFARAVARAASKPPPPPPNPPQYASPQVATPAQWNGGGTPLQRVDTTSSAPPPGYGVYSPEYLEQQLRLNAESPVHGPLVPENFDSDFPDFDPLDRDDHFRPVHNVEVDDEPVTDAAAIELAEELAEEIAEGRGLDLFQDNEVLQDSDNVEDTDLNRADVIERLEAGGYEVESSEWGLAGDNITRTTITDPESGETIHEYYDHDTDRYWVEVTDVDGKELSGSDVRGERGRKVTVSEDEETGGTTTRLEDDWGDGSTVEITVLPDSDVVTIKTTDGDGNSETVVIAEDGSQTVLEPEQETAREDVEDIVDGVADGQSIEEIAEEQGLTREQVIAQLAAVGLEFESAVEGEGPSYVSTTKITDQESGDVIASHETGPDGIETSRVIDPDGNEVRRTKSPDGSTTEVVIEPDGRETETTVDADGTTTTTVAYEQNGVTVEEVTVDDGETTTTVVDEDGTRTELEPEQEMTREGIEDIAEAVANGQGIDEIAEALGLATEQIIAQLAAAGFQVSEWADSHDNVTRRIVDTQSGEDIARYHFSMESMVRSTLHVDADGNETTRTEYMDGRSVETVVEDNGRKTVTSESADGEVTTRVTHNGYTVTTPPDGDITVRNDEDGTEIDVERGAYEASLVETLLGIDLDSSDPEEAMAAEIVMAAIEQLLAGEAVKGIQKDIDEKQKELDEAIEEYGPGHQPGTNVSFDNPYGNPPPGKAPSGGDWVPMYGLWMDPEVARATMALNILLAEQLEAGARAQNNQTTLDVFALDPEYEGAMERAGETLDEALAPHGMRWVRPEPDDSLTLEEARERQEAAETRHGEAGEAKEAYREAQRLLERGITSQADIPTIDSVGICTGEESSEEIQAMAAEYRRDRDLREAAEDIRDSFFFDAGSSISEGDALLASYTVSWLELQVELAEPGSEDHERLSLALEEAEKAEEDAGIQVEAAQAYRDFYAAKSEAGKLTIEAYESSDDLLAVFNEDKGILEEGKTFRTVGGKALGEFTGVQTIHENEDGQLVVVTHFEHRTTEETLAPDEMSEWWENNRDPELTTQWLDLRDERQSADQAVNQAGEALQNTLERHLGIELESLETDIEGFEQELDELFERHGEGSAEVPDNLIPGGDEPQKITVGDHELLVTPQMAEEYEERGLEILIGSDQPVGIEIDGEWLWVHPEIAMTSIALDIAKQREEQQRPILEAAQGAVRDQAVRYALMADEPMQRMGESNDDFMGRLEYGYLEGDNRDKALDGLYQPLFQDLRDQGFDSEFSVQSSDADLKTTIEETYGLRGGTEEGQEAIDDILGEIRDIGGDSPEVKAVPLFHVGQNEGVSQVMLLAVRGEEGETRYVDITGRHYSDLENFRDKNRMFSEDGLLVAPRDLEMRPDGSGNIPLEVVAAAESSDWETVVDPLIGIGTGVATVLSFTPAAPVAAPLAVAGGLYLGGRAVYHQWDHTRHGGEWNDFESAMNYLSVATTVLPIGASAIRAFNIRSVLSSAPYNVSMTRGQAFMSSIGAVKPNSTMAQNASLYMSSKGGWNRTARMLDWGAIGTGVPLMGMAAQQLIVHGDQMTGLQKTDAFIGLMTGFVGTGLGTYGLVATRPGRTSSSENTPTTIQLMDESGAPLNARVLGTPPESADAVYIQPTIGPRPRGDETGVQGKTHLLHRDAETGEVTVMPWIRGGAENTVPGRHETASPPPGVARLYRLDDLAALNQASEDGSLPPGHYVHFVRSSKTGLDDATFTIEGGTVPSSGHIDGDGHIRWPSSRTGWPATFSVADDGNGQRTITIHYTTGNEQPRTIRSDDDVYAIVSDTRVSDIRAQIKGDGLPFAVYGSNGLWSVSGSGPAPSVGSEPSGQVSPSPDTAARTPSTQEASSPEGASSQQPQPRPNQAASDGITVTMDAEGEVVHLNGVGDDWVSVLGHSDRKRTRSPYDRKATSEALPETITVPRELLERALGPEALDALPNDPMVRISIGQGEHGASTANVVPAGNDGNGNSRGRIWTARGLASALTGGALFGTHSAATHGWTGDVLNRMAAPENSPALMINGGGFVARGSLIFFKARFDEKIRLKTEALDQGKVTAELLNWDASRVISSRRALDLTDTQVASVGNLAEAFWGKYQLLNDLPVTQESAQRGWTDDVKKQAIDDAVNDYKTGLKEIAGEEALTVNPLDPRTWKGIAFNSAVLTTHLINDVVSYQYLMNGGILDSSAPLALQIVDKAGLVGFLTANVVLAGSAASKVGTGLAKVDLSSLPLINRLTKTGTATGSFFYGIMTPPWAALTLHGAADAFSNGHWFLGSAYMAALPFQVGLSYYGIRGLRDDAITMVRTWKDGQDPQRSWPMRTLFPLTTIPLAALTGTEAVNQFSQGNYLTGSALAGGTLIQAYFIDLASRRLNWTDAAERHGPFRQLSGDQRLGADENRIWKGVGLTLAGGMAIPALLDVRNWLDEREWLPEWEWLTEDRVDDENEDVTEGGGVEEEPSVDDRPDVTPSETSPVGESDRVEPLQESEQSELEPQTNLWQEEHPLVSPIMSPLGGREVAGRSDADLETSRDCYCVSVKPGQTLGGIAIKHGVGVEEVVLLNIGHIQDPHSLAPGDRVYLPRRDKVS